MATKKHFTSIATTCKFEFVRKAPHGGLELVKVKGGKTTVTPVQTTARVEGRNRLMVGVEPRVVNGKLEVW